MTTRLLTIVAGVAGIAAVGLFAATSFMAMSLGSEELLEGATWSAATLLLALIGMLVAIRRPRHVVGWLLLGAGLAELTAGATSLYGEYVTASGTGLPAGGIVEW